MKLVLAWAEHYWWLLVAGVLFIVTAAVIYRWGSRRGVASVGPQAPSFVDMALDAAKDAKAEAMVEKASAKATSDVQIKQIQQAASDPDPGKRLDKLANIMAGL